MQGYAQQKSKNTGRKTEKYKKKNAGLLTCIGSGGNLDPKCAPFFPLSVAQITRTPLSMLRIEGFVSIYTTKKKNAGLLTCVFLSGVSGGNRTHDLQGHNLAL